ncbi:uncharacterized protein LOC129961824 [Argiope bruennichi]|uniref:uncharacterized protein LOC129961824 n=1 Tax=Argiope bruennichi TaxID=94029 RepID=UPI002494EEE4|nr:uncharacterized protein LOC129961824 [Argiope bruennichi]
MHLKMILFFAVLGSRYGASVGVWTQICGDKQSDICIDEFFCTWRRLVRSPKDKVICPLLKKLANCLKEAVKECPVMMRSPDTEAGRRKIRILISDTCTEGGLEIPRNVTLCLHTIKDELWGCVDVGKAKTQEYVSQTPNREVKDKDKLQCLIRQFIAECFVQKTENGCGKEASEIVIRKSLKAPTLFEACIKHILKEISKDIKQREVDAYRPRPYIYK